MVRREQQVCASRHHHDQPALALRVARHHGIPIDETIARSDGGEAFSFADLDRAI
jgi:hypothetical protein